jgi:hypothetical protein
MWYILAYIVPTELNTWQTHSRYIGCGHHPHLTVTYRFEMTHKELKTAFKYPQTIKEVLGELRSRLNASLGHFANKGLLGAAKGFTIPHLNVLRNCFGSFVLKKKPEIVEFLEKQLARASEIDRTTEPPRASDQMKPGYIYRYVGLLTLPERSGPYLRSRGVAS